MTYAIGRGSNGQAGNSVAAAENKLKGAVLEAGRCIRDQVGYICPPKMATEIPTNTYHRAASFANRWDLRRWGFLTPKRSERRGSLMRRTIMVLAALSATLLAASAGTAASPQAVTISASRPSVVFGNSATLSGKVSDHKVGEKVEVLAEPSGASSFSTLTTVDTTAGGQWTDLVKPTIETSYQAKWKSANSST